MNEYLKFAVVALVGLLIGVPLWTLVLAPGEFSPAMAVDPGFWVTIALGMVMLLFGFWVGQQSGLDE